MNTGSSSVKFSVCKIDERKMLIKGQIEKIGIENSFIHFKKEFEEVKRKIECKNHTKAVKYILNLLNSPEIKALSSINDINAVVHRVVHGGEKLVADTIITNEIEKIIEELCPLAPLHNPSNLEGIRICRQLLPEIPHIAVFDTAYHKTIPEYAYHYAIPSKWYLERKFRRYGFHGTSVEYVVDRAKTILKNHNINNLIVLHLGNGASVTAVRDGKSIDTSMGMTPLEGLIMGTRSGDIDPGVVIAMQRNEGLSIDQVDEVLNKDSGLFGVTNGFRDMRDIEKRAEEGDKSAQLAIQMSVYRVQKYIGAYFTILGGLDAIIFTGGIGERSYKFRQMVLEGLIALGVDINLKQNESAIHGEEAIISSSESKVQVIVVPTNEELMMAIKASQKIQSTKEYQVKPN